MKYKDWSPREADSLEQLNNLASDSVDGVRGDSHAAAWLQRFGSAIRGGEEP